MRRGPIIVGLALAALFSSWVVPPLYQKALHLCPVRPGHMPVAQAVPPYARKYGISCSQCHTAFPALNDYGREFKLNGYVREREKKEGVLETKDGLWTEKSFPWGAVVKSRPYDKKQTDREFKLRPLHELELFVAGGDAARKYSYFMEVESEDENGYSPKFGELQLGYHPSRYANILLANRSFFAMDPYQTLANMGQLTVSKRQVFTKGQASSALDDMKQAIAVFGEASKEGIGSLYYAAGVSADMNESGAGDKGAGDKEGEGPKDLSFRLAYDCLKGGMLGTFASFGHEGGGAVDKIKYSRVGVDALAELAGLTARTALVYSFDKNLSTNDRENNRGAYAELFYAFKKDDRPIWVPLIRQDWYQTNDGRRQFASLTAQLSHYFLENVRTFVEYTADTVQTGAPGTARPGKNHRWLAQLELGF
ncbi:MAG: hypothetical protein HY549_01520 [Elusimicrobia bacterium]|nr:hypothetical protein [Elusimicrobiota bacterium]